MQTARLQRAISYYEEARAVLNSRIGAWIFILETNRKTTIDSLIELEQINLALKKVDTFSGYVDNALFRTACFRPVAWKEVAAGIIAFGPLAIEVLSNFFNSEDEKIRRSLVMKLGALRITAWDDISSSFASLDQESLVSDYAIDKPETGLAAALRRIAGGTQAAVAAAATSAYKTVSMFAIPANIPIQESLQNVLPDFLRSGYVILPSVVYEQSVAIQQAEAEARSKEYLRALSTAAGSATASPASRPPSAAGSMARPASKP